MNAKQAGRDEEPAPRDAPPYEVKIEHDRKCLRTTMRGLWTRAVFEAFAAELRAAEDEMRSFAGTTYTLVDGVDFEMQDPAIAQLFPPLVSSFGLDESRRTAVVMQGAIARSQARETGNVVNARYFRTMEQATDWLFSDEA